MADENFILTLVGRLDENETKKNVEDVLKKLNKSIGENEFSKIKIFDKDELNRQGTSYVTKLEDIKKQITDLLQLDESTGVNIAKIFDDNGEISKFKVSLQDAVNVLKEYNFERAKFTDGTVGAVLTSGTGLNSPVQIANGYETMNKSIQRASGSVKIFTQESIDGLKRLETRVQQTNQIVSRPNFDVSNSWFAADVQSIEEFASEYEQVVNKINGAPDITHIFDSKNDIVGFTANIKTAEGAIQQLRYRWAEVEDEFGGKEGFFQFAGSTVLDNAFTKQAEAIGNLENKVKSFKEKLNDGVTFKFIDTKDTLNNLQLVENIIAKLKSNAGLNNIVDIENLEKSLNLIITTATETEKVEKKKQSELNKTNKIVDQQSVKLQKNRVLLNNFLNTKVNPDSASFVGNSDKLDDVLTKLQEVIKIRAELSRRNKAGEILSEKDMGRLTVGLLELRNLFAEARKESGQSIDRNESMAKVAKEIDVLNAKLDANIAKWKNMGVYAGDFKTDVEKLQETLNKKDASGNFIIDSSNKIRELEKDMGIYNSKALELQRSNKVVRGSIDDVSQSVDLYREKMKTLELRYENMIHESESFRTVFNNVKNSLANVNTPEELRKWEDSFKKMQEAAKRTGMTLRNDLRTDELGQKLALLRQQINAFEQSNPRAANIYSVAFSRLKEELDNVANSNDFKKIQNEFRSLKLTINQAGVAGKTFGQRMQEAFKRMSSYLGATSMMMYTVRAIREIINNVKELDTQMVRLRRVTNETEETYKNMFDNAVKSAKELNTSVKDIVESTASLSKLNFEPAEAAKLAELINMYNRVAEINNIETATNDIVSIINGFTDLTADDSERIVDVLDNLGNKFAVSAADLGQILTRSSAALSEANNSLEESVALGTVANSIAMDSAKVGNALKNLSLRIQGAKAKIEEEGLDGEYMVESTADLRKLVIAATGVDILEKDQKTFRSTYEILLDISKVWHDIDDVTQSALLQKLAGKQQANVIASILNNGELLERVYNEAMNSAGVAQAEQEKWADSVEAKMGRITATFESISSNMLSSTTFKNTLDIINTILEKIEQLTKSGMTAIPVFTSLSSLMGAMGNGFISIQNMNNSKSLITAYNKTLSQSVEEQIRFSNSIVQTNPGFYGYISNLNGAKASLGSYTSYLATTAAKTVALRIATTALNVALNGLIGLGIGLLTTWISGLANEEEHLAESFKSNTQEAKENVKELEEYKNKIEEIMDSSKDEAQKTLELNDIKDQLHEKYRIEIKDVEDLTEARLNLIDAINKESLKEADDGFNKTIDDYQRYKEMIENPNGNRTFSFIDRWNAKIQEVISNVIPITDLYGDYVGDSSVNSLNINKGGAQYRKNGNGDLYFRSGKNTNISKEVQDLFDSFNVEELSSGKESLISFDLGSEDTNVLDYYDKLKNTLSSLAEAKTTLGDEWTKDDEKIYQITKSVYDELTDFWYDDNKVAENFLASAEQQAKRILLMVESQNDTTKMTSDEYKKAALKLANGDSFVIAKIEELINTSDGFEKLENTADSTINPLTEVLSNLKKIDDTCTSLSASIKEADESFEKLNKTIDTNKDADKFFSASDIIEVLELYPSLNDAILKTEYGYKIEEKAIEALRESKVNERKVALQSQLDETQSLLDTTRAKLEAYRQELSGVQNVATAKAKLAQLEAQLAKTNLTTTDPKYNNGAYLQEQITKYKDYLEASEAVSKYQETIDKLGIEIKVLGTRFDNAKDATGDYTNELNKQKDSVKELNDEYKKAKDSIEDLIKLTMDMIKKNKELQRDNLKNQLDNFKELIDKRKELIDLEKSELEFKKGLKEQNKDLLKIQQELDALSVEGVNYSLDDLKRKAELEEKLAEQSDKRTDFLYDHEVDLRKDALDKEQEAFEEKIETQVKAIEDYLSKEGKLRQDAIDLINGKSEEFYNNLLEYNMTYTDRSRYEFQKLWDSAYDAILKYAGGELNVELALINLIGAMNDADQQLKNIENSINNIKHATDDAKKSMYDFAQVIADTQAKAKQLYNAPIGPGLANSPLYYETLQNVPSFKKDGFFKNGFPKFHDGGIVGGISNEKGEVLAKLLSGEVVATEAQARNFMEHTLPKLASNNYTTNNSSVAPVINIGDIVVNGNADSSILNKLNEVRQNIVDDVFKVVNNQRNTFAGGRVRAY